MIRCCISHLFFVCLYETFTSTSQCTMYAIMIFISWHTGEEPERSVLCHLSMGPKVT